MYVAVMFLESATIAINFFVSGVLGGSSHLVNGL